ncbi:ParB N-terminal domain-containing protein [Legionella longbeachae]
MDSFASQYQPREDINTIALQELAQSIELQSLIESLIVRTIAKQL